MIPSSFATLGAFLLLLAPGTVWETQRAKRKPEAKRSTLQEISQIVLSSMLASGAAALSLWLLWIVPFAIEAATPWDFYPFGEHVFITLLIASATSGLACFYAWCWACIKWGTWNPIKDSPVWHQALSEWGTSPSVPPMLLICLSNGNIWKGRYKSIDSGAEDQERFIALAAPLRFRNSRSEPLIARESAGIALIKVSDISIIEVSYPAG